MAGVFRWSDAEREVVAWMDRLTIETSQVGPGGGIKFLSR